MNRNVSVTHRMYTWITLFLVLKSLVGFNIALEVLSLKFGSNRVQRMFKCCMGEFRGREKNFSPSEEGVI